MNTETQQQNEAPQPPPLTQGRMYQWVNAAQQPIPEDWQMVQLRYTDKVPLPHDLFEREDLGFRKKGGTGFLPFPFVEWLEEVTQSAPHTPAPAVSDEWITIEKENDIDCGQYIVSYFNPMDSDKKLYVIHLWKGRDGWYYDNSEKERADGNTLTVNHYQPLPSPPAASTPAPIASDGEANKIKNLLDELIVIRSATHTQKDYNCFTICIEKVKEYLPEPSLEASNNTINK